MKKTEFMVEWEKNKAFNFKQGLHKDPIALK